MTGIAASAPGKVVLSGEYAVLDGAPAVCMAVDRRATVRVRHAGDAFNTVSAPGYSEVQGRFRSRRGSIEWLQGEAEFKLVDIAWRTLGHTDKGGLSIKLDSRAFYDAASGQKLGLGSSAALTVALVAALTQSTSVQDSATRVHRLLQRGVGSGVDVATSVTGGLIKYSMQGARTSPLRWPDGLAFRIVWTGVSASTGSKLDRLQGTGNGRTRKSLTIAAKNMAAAWQSASSALRQLPAYIEALRDFSEAHDLGIFDAGHDKLVADATSAGLLYKPCGAGGGDVGILLGKTFEQLDEFLTGGVAQRYRPLDCAMDPNGVDLESN